MSTGKKGEDGKLGANQAAKHLEVSGGWELTPEQKVFLQGLTQIAGSRYRRLSDLEAAFVETLLVQAAYKQSRGEAILATNEQLQQLLEARHGIKLDDKCRKIRDLKRLFITKGKNKASKIELLVMEEEGVRGKPSRYRLTGLAAAFSIPQHFTDDDQLSH
jgi:hypothetical protein